MLRRVLLFAVSLLLGATLALVAQEPPRVLEGETDGLVLRVDNTRTQDFVRTYFVCRNAAKPIGIVDPGMVEAFEAQYGDLYACNDGYLILQGEDWYAPIELRMLRSADQRLAPEGLGAVLLCPTRLRTGLYLYKSRQTHLTCDEAERAGDG